MTSIISRIIATNFAYSIKRINELMNLIKQKLINPLKSPILEARFGYNPSFVHCSNQQPKYSEWALCYHQQWRLRCIGTIPWRRMLGQWCRCQQESEVATRWGRLWSISHVYMKSISSTHPRYDLPVIAWNGHCISHRFS